MQRKGQCGHREKLNLVALLDGFRVEKRQHVAFLAVEVRGPRVLSWAVVADFRKFGCLTWRPGRG
jgi:hypothetical protein